MADDKRPLAFVAAESPPRTRPSNYPEPFFTRMAKREKRPLGDRFGLTNFGVNLTRLAPGGEWRSSTGTAGRTSSSTSSKAPRPSSPTKARSSSPPACARASRRAGSPTSSSTAPGRTSSTSRSATARPATRAAIRATTSPPPRARWRWVFTHKDGTPY